MQIEENELRSKAQKKEEANELQQKMKQVFAFQLRIKQHRLWNPEVQPTERRREYKNKPIKEMV